MAMSFPTKTLDLSGGPINLMVEPDIAAAIAAAAADGARVFVQNVSPRAKVYYAERTDAPSRTDRGHRLDPGDGLALRFTENVTPGGWMWATSAGLIAVTPADD